MSYELSAEQVRDFYEIGYFVIPNFWDARQVAEMRSAFERLYATAQKLRTTQMHRGSSFVLNDRQSFVAVARVVWAGAAEPVLLKYAEDPRLVALAGQILGSKEMDQLINQAHFKFPGDGIGFPWHQDIQHRDKKPGDWRDVNGRGSYVQTLATLDDMTADNGPVMFIPGTSKRGRLNIHVTDYSGAEYEEFSSKNDLIDENSAVPVVAPAGSMLVFSPYAVHGSFPNQSDKTRFSFINGYAYPGANSRVYPGEGSGRRLRVK